MRLLMVFLAASAALFGQRHNPSGFGSVLYPGTGGPPPIRAPGAHAMNPGFPVALSNTIRGVPPVAHPSHGRRSVVAVPVFVGGGYYPGYGYEQPQAQGPQVVVVQSPPPPPVVIINQSYQPERVQPVMQDLTDPEATMKRYDAPAGPNAAPRTAVQDEKATIYLIAFKDSTIMPAIAYWIEDSTLNYVTPQAKMNRVSLDLVDHEMSKRLNDERKVEFTLR